MSRSVCYTAVLAKGSVTLARMVLPTHIIYRESSFHPTSLYSVEVRRHSQSCYLTPRVWFGSLGVIIVSTLVGAAARLPLPPTD